MPPAGWRKERKVCSVAKCDSAAEAVGMCSKHYQRYRNRGSVEDRIGDQAPPDVRFWRLVDRGADDECWLWLGTKLPQGYGNFILRSGVTLRAPRFSYELNVGPIPPKMHVLHKCDDPRCVNPKHLFLGSNRANVDDKLRKQRQARGERSGVARLTEEQVRQIILDGRSHRDIARSHGIGKSTVGAIKTGKAWSHIRVEVQ